MFFKSKFLHLLVGIIVAIYHAVRLQPISSAQVWKLQNLMQKIKAVSSYFVCHLITQLHS